MTSDLFLIHGAWQGAWVWDALIPELHARGWICHAVDLPENGQPGAPPGPASLEAYVAHCASVMPAQATVIGHSGAGVIASQLAEDFPERVECLVYLAGMMLPSGVGFSECVRESGLPASEVEGIWPHLEWSADGVFSSVPVQAALDIFLHDVPEPAARLAAGRLTRQRETGRALRANLTPERFGRVPRLYIEATRDRSVVPAMQRRMQALVAGARILSMDTGHVPQAAQPVALARLLDEALAEKKGLLF